MFGKKKSCKAEEGTQKLRNGHKKFKELMEEIRLSAIEQQKQNGSWLPKDKEDEIASV